jgi:hypothetical protein
MAEAVSPDIASAIIFGAVRGVGPSRRIAAGACCKRPPGADHCHAPGRGMTQASHNRNPRRRYGIRGVRQQRLGPRESVREIGDSAQGRRCSRVVLNSGTSLPVTMPLRDDVRSTLRRDAADNIVSEV